MKGYPLYLSFPFRIGPDGRTASPPDLDAHVRDELLQLLLTTLGERLFLPELGTNLRRLVFEKTDVTARSASRSRLSPTRSEVARHARIVTRAPVSTETARSRC